MKIPVTIVIHTLNEEKNLPFALDSVAAWADQVCVVDSESIDGTPEIASKYGAELLSRPCWRGGLVAQRNWALESIAFRNDWVFILDADEVMEDDLKAEVAGLVSRNDSAKDGYWCRFKVYWLGKWIPRSSMYPSWSLRLFRHDLVRYEIRDVNSHPLLKPGRDGYLSAHLINYDRRGFSYYLKRVDEFSTLEAIAYKKRLTNIGQESLLKGRLLGSRAERRRYLKNLYIKLPFKGVVIFLYLYFVRLGFLEGRVGFDYAFLKAVQEWATTVKMREGDMI
jgi:glycosyltransferase involved in cell wall biosynthesis